MSFLFILAYLAVVLTLDCTAIYYQAGRDHTATKSGIDLLPLMLAVVVSIISAGQLVARIGRYWGFLVVGPMFGAVGFVRSVTFLL